MRTFAITLCLALAASPAWARERLARVISRGQGLPTPEVTSITQDASGFLWFGTPGGLVRWDGTRAIAWAQGTITGDVSRLTATPDGDVWAAEEGGVLWDVHGDRVTAVDGVTAVSDLRVDGAGGLWVAAHGGLAHRAPDGTWDTRDGIAGKHVWKLGVLGDGTAVAATADAAYRLDTGAQLVALPYIVSVRQSDSGALWIATDGASLYEVPAGAAPIERGHWAARTWDMAVRGDDVWMVMGGMTIHDVIGGVPEDIGDDGRVPAADRAFVDREGSLWLATPRGAVQLVEPTTAMWTMRDGLDFTAARFLARNREGVWISTWGGGWTRIDHDSLAHGTDVMLRGKLCVDGDAMWTGSAGMLRLRRGGAWSAYPLPGGDDYASCVRSPRGVILSSAGGLWLAGTPPTPIAAPSSQLHTRLGQLLVDRDGRLWVAGVDGVCSAPLADAIAGTPTWSCEQVDGVNDIYGLVETPSGALWMATFGRGLLVRDDGVWNEATPALPSRVAALVTRARDGQTMWIGGDGYLDRVRETPGGFEIVEELGEAQGLPQIGGADLVEDDDGTLWVPTDAGVLEIPPRARAPLPPIAHVALVASRVDGRDGVGNALSASSEDNDVELTFSAFAFRDPARVLYRVRVDGGAWSAPDAGATMRLVSVPAGDHAIEVQASLDGASWASLPAPIALTVPRPWWRRPWLWALAVALLIAAIVAIQRARYRVRLRLAQQRVRIAMDLHDEIGSGLGSIGVLAGMAATGGVPPERRDELTGRVAKTAHRLGESLTDIVAALRAGGDRLDALVDHLAERGGALMPGDEPRLEVRAPAEWPAEPMSLAARRAVQLIAVEALHNAARHARARVVELGAAADGRRWRVWIEDDGVGVDGGTRPRSGGGNGMGTMRARADAIGASLRVGAGAGGAGTRIEVEFDPRAREL